MERKRNPEEKLQILQDETVRQVVYDILHKRREKYSKADNSGQHIEYKEMVKDLENDYRKLTKTDK